MRKVTFPFVNRFDPWPDDRNQFKRTKLNDAKTDWVGDYYGSMNAGQIPDYIEPVPYAVTWTDAQPQGGGDPSVLLFDNNYTPDYAMMVVKVGDVGVGLHQITITCEAEGPAGDFVIPIKHVQSGINLDEGNTPRIAMTATKNQGNNTVTCTMTFQQAGYYLVDNDCLNEKYIGAYSCKPLMIRVVS